MLQYAGYQHEDKTFVLNEGWNLLPVLSDQPADPVELFAQMIEHLILVKEIAGNKLFWPEFSVQTLDFLLPGNAYWVKVSQQVTVEFN